MNESGVMYRLDIKRMYSTDRAATNPKPMEQENAVRCTLKDDAEDRKPYIKYVE